MANQTKYETYEQVPTYRKQWFFWTMFFILPNVLSFGGAAWDVAFLTIIGVLIQMGSVALLLLGDIYYVKKNEVKSFGKANRIVAGVIVGFFLISGIVKGCNSKESILEKSAVPVVTQILAENLGRGNAATCKEVEITEKISDGLYRASAILNNGNKLKIIIEEKGNNRILVSISR